MYSSRSNIVDDYDGASDLSRWHKVKAVPQFLFLDEGAVVSQHQAVLVQNIFLYRNHCICHLCYVWSEL